jgi:ribosomal protein S18 acetylase RimI-like enzyme
VDGKSNRGTRGWAEYPSGPTLSAVATNQRAIKRYRRLGFVEEGQLPREYRRADGTFLDGVLMFRFVKST